MIGHEIVIDNPADAQILLLKSIHRTLIVGFGALFFVFLLVVAALLIVAGQLQEMNHNIEEMNNGINGAVTLLKMR